MTDVTSHPTVVELSRVRVRDGFNPRNQRDPKKFAETMASIEANGVLQPVLVTPDPDTGDYMLVAGEGRWLACSTLGMAEIPVHVREDIDADTGGLELAILENVAREDLDPVDEALAFHRLLEAGRTRKGIAEQLGIAQKRVTERLEILKLPEALHPQVASGLIPPSAIKPLVKLEKLHAGLAACAVARVQREPSKSWQHQLTWADLIADPVAVLVAEVDAQQAALPDGVYDASDPVLATELVEEEKVREQLVELCTLLGGDAEDFVVRFDRNAVEQAVALNAAVTTSDGYHHLIVGKDVAVQLAADYIAACLKNQRDMADRQAAAERGGTGADGSGEPAAEVSEEELKEQRRAERDAQQAKRDSAAAFNAELGVAALKHLAKLKVDHAVLQILTAVDLAGDIDAVAMRGARYCLPGWMAETTTAGGKTKTVYLERQPSGTRAKQFLDGAQSMPELAGRLFVLLACARYAREDCVAQSARSMYSLRVRQGVPFAGRSSTWSTTSAPTGCRST